MRLTDQDVFWLLIGVMLFFWAIYELTKPPAPPNPPRSRP